MMHKMPVVTVSPKYQVVIPKEVRARMALKPGQKLQVWYDGGGVRLSKVADPRDLRGIFKDDPLPPFRREGDRDL